VGLRIRLFRVFYWVQKDSNTSFAFAITLILLLFAQIFALLISPVMKLPFKGSLYTYVGAVFDVIRIYPAVIRNGGEITYWFFMCSPLVLILIYLTLVLLIDAALNLTKGKSLRLYLSIRIIQQFHCLFFWVLLIPNFDFFISIFECDANTGKHKILTSLTCWSALHACYCAIFSVGLLLFLSVTVLISMLNNESRPSNTDALTRLDTN